MQFDAMVVNVSERKLLVFGSVVTFRVIFQKKFSTSASAEKQHQQQQQQQGHQQVHHEQCEEQRDDDQVWTRQTDTVESGSCYENVSVKV